MKRLTEADCLDVLLVRLWLRAEVFYDGMTKAGHADDLTGFVLVMDPGT